MITLLLKETWIQFFVQLVKSFFTAIYVGKGWVSIGVTHHVYLDYKTFHCMFFIDHPALHNSLTCFRTSHKKSIQPVFCLLNLFEGPKL